MKEKLKAILLTAWNEPRHFFFWLALLSLAVFVTGGTIDSQFPQFTPPPWVQTCAVAGMFCLAAGFVTGVLGFLLAWIPPVRLLLAWLLQRRFFALACLVTLVALFYAVENWRGKSAWEKFKREQAARGEPFDVAGVAPTPVPDEQNFAMAPIVMTTYSAIMDRNGRKKDPIDSSVVNRLQMPLEAERLGFNSPKETGVGNWRKSEKANLQAWQAYFRQVAARTNLFPVAPQPQSPAADVLLALSKYDSALEELRQAGQRPHSRFPLEYDADFPYSILLPHLAGLKACAQALRLRAVAELELGQTEKALEDVKLMLRLAEALRNEPILISQLVRISIVEIALQPVWEGLAARKWSDGQLAALDRELKKLDHLADYRIAMRGEVVLVAGTIDYLRRTCDLDSIGDDISEPFSRLIPSGWFYQNQVRCSRFMVQHYMPVVDPEQRLVSTAADARAGQACIQEISRPNPYNWLEARLLPSLGASSKRFAAIQSGVDLARVACALERHRLAQGQYPEALEALSPRFIEKLPHDVINGQPLHYRRTGDAQFVLYSVGWNETDEGGKVVLRKDGKPDAASGDWVWPWVGDSRSMIDD